MTELCTNGTSNLIILRKQLPPVEPQRPDLGVNQLQYLIDRGWIDRRRFVPREK